MEIILEILGEIFSEIFISETDEGSRKSTYWLHGILRFVFCGFFIVLGSYLIYITLFQSWKLWIFLLGTFFTLFFLIFLIKSTRKSLKNYRKTYKK